MSPNRERSRSRIVVAVKADLWSSLVTPEDSARLQGLGEVFYQNDAPLDPPGLVQLVAGADVLVTGWGTPSISGAVLAAAPGLGLVAHSAGSVKKLVDAEVFARGVRVTSSAAALAPAVAEHTLALIYAMLRGPHRMNARIKSGRIRPWGSSGGENATPELASQCVGIVGASRTARPVIAVLRAIGARVLVSDPYLSPEAAATLGVEPVELNELIQRSDIVSLHAPLTDRTRGMIGRDELAKLKNGAIFINTARGELVDEAALIQELRSGRISAALDTFAVEPLPMDSPLLELDNVMLTPHQAGSSPAARQRQTRFVVDEVQRYLSGKPLEHEVLEKHLAQLA